MRTLHTRLLIIGAGGLGREVAAWAEQIPCEKREWRLGGFLDRNPSALKGYSHDLEVVGDFNTYEPQPMDRFVCAVGFPEVRRQIAEVGEDRKCLFETLVHPSAVIGPRCTLGQGVIICPNSILTCDARVGDHALINIGCTVGHDSEIGEFAVLCPQVALSGGAKIGPGCFIGTHATVLPNVKVGPCGVVGAGSVVLRNVNGGATVIGVPAKQLGADL